MSIRRLATSIFAVVAVLALAIPAAAQSGTIVGTVTDASTQRPISGAQITIQGTTQGTITNEDGRFTLTNLPAGTHTVRVQIIGYERASETVELAEGATEMVNFELGTSAVALDAVVVTAIGEQQTREIANAIGKVDAAEINERVAPVNLAETITAQTPGVTVLQGSGTTGGNQTMRIRGASSISLSNQPLVYVDGVRIENDPTSSGLIWTGGQSSSRLNDINPEDIERIEVIKGPAAATLYGTEAAAGVIQIFTKQGSPSGQPRFQIQQKIGTNVIDNTQFQESVWHPRSFFGDLVPDTTYTFDPFVNANPFQDGQVVSTSASVRGGTEAFTYFVSGERSDEEGVQPANGFTRYFGRGNFTVRPTETFDVTVSTGYTTNDLLLPQNDNNAWGLIPIHYLSFPWEVGVNATDPVFGGDAQSTCAANVEYVRFFYNLLTQTYGFADADARAYMQSNGITVANDAWGCADNAYFAGRTPEDIATITSRQQVERFTGSVTANYRPFDWFSNRFTLGYDGLAEHSTQLVPVDPDRPFGSDSEGYKIAGTDVTRNLTLDYAGNLNFDLTPSVNSKTSFGVQYYREFTQSDWAWGLRFPAGAPTVSSAAETFGGENVFESRTLGFYVQEQVGINNRIFLTGAVRADDNSAFGQDYDIAIYPKAQLSWVMAEEPWFPDGIFSQMRLRAAWGKSGKQPGLFSALQRFSPVAAPLQGGVTVGATPLNVGNPDLAPEIGSELEIGTDFSFFDDRLGFEVTYYDQVTADAIVSTPLKPSRGFPAPVFRNLAEMTNKGWEIGTEFRAIDTRDVRLSFNATYSTNKNEITQLENDVDAGWEMWHREGYSFASYFGTKYSIVNEGDSSYAKVDTVFYGDPASPDSIELEQFIGPSTPTYEGSFSSTLDLFGFVSIYALVDFKGGHYKLNNNTSFRCTFLGGGEYGGICPEMFERDADGEYTDNAKLWILASGLGGARADHLAIESADFAKLRTMSVRFTLPDNWAGLIGAGGASIALTGQNLYTWTDYSGLDPESSTYTGTNTRNEEFLTLPPHPRYTATFTLNF